LQRFPAVLRDGSDALDVVLGTEAEVLGQLNAKRVKVEAYAVGEASM